MTDEQPVDPFWAALLGVLRELGPVVERRSRYADKPALWLHGREIAHSETSGVVDLRITRRGWTNLRDLVVEDRALERDPTLRDWIILRGSPSDVDRLRPVLAAAVEANGG